MAFGNPLAPLIFILFTDALHEGLRFCPLREDGVQGGYVFLRSRLRIASLGFADDLMTFAESWADIFLSHEWVLAFFYAHGGEINSNKTTFIISDAVADDARWLRTLSGESISPKPPTTFFRYLGIFLNVDLNWTQQIFAMKAYVTEWLGITQRSGISAVKVFETFRTILLPRLDLGLTFACIPDNFLTSWSRKILGVIFAADGWPENRVTKLSIDAFSDLVDTPLLLERYWGNKLSALLYDLNAPLTLSGQSTRSRLSALTGADQSSQLSLYDVRLIRRYKISRFARVIEYLAARDCLLSCPPSGSDSLNRLVDEGRACLAKALPPLRVLGSPNRGWA